MRVAEIKGRPFPAHSALINISDPDCDFASLDNKQEFYLKEKD